MHIDRPSIFARASEASYPAIRPNQSDSQDSDHTSRGHVSRSSLLGHLGKHGHPHFGGDVTLDFIAGRS